MSRDGLAWAMVVIAVLAAGCARPHAVIPVAPGPGWEETGQASWYGVPYHGRQTASGEVYDMHQMTAAHRTLPFGTWLAVEHIGTGRSTEVRINDRGPFVDGRILDLSYAAARVLDAIGPGVIPVHLRVIAPPPAAAAPPPGEAAPAPLTFAVQLGAFADEERARRLQQELQALGWDARVHPSPIDETLLYRVRVGRFHDRGGAMAAARDLTARGRPAVVVTE